MYPMRGIFPYSLKVNAELEKSPLTISENKIMIYLKSSFLSALHRSPNVYVRYIHFQHALKRQLHKEPELNRNTNNIQLY